MYLNNCNGPGFDSSGAEYSTKEKEKITPPQKKKKSLTMIREKIQMRKIQNEGGTVEKNDS
jgi:hypothetical protein